MVSPSRAVALVVALAVPVGPLIVACGAGDEIAYTNQGLAGDGGDSGIVRDDAGRLVAESGIDVLPPANDGGGVALPDATSPCAKLDPDAGCDPTQGLGCCLPVSGEAENVCVEAVQYAAGNSCAKPNDVFVACIGSDNDNACCWGPGPNGTVSVRYRTSCAGGVEACDPAANAAAGAVCPNTGGPCTPIKCRGLELGYCAGQGGGDSNPCP